MAQAHCLSAQDFLERMDSGAFDRTLPYEFTNLSSDQLKIVARVLAERARPRVPFGRNERKVLKEHCRSAEDLLHKSGLRPRPVAPCLIGKRFKLKERTLAIEVFYGGRTAVTIPAGAIINVVSGPATSGPIDDDRTVEVLWQNRKLEIFRCDVSTRGVEITD